MDIWQKHLNEVVNSCWNYAGRINDFDGHISNAVLGLTGESGEVADVLKKMLYHTEKDYREKMLYELGDVAFYLLKTIELMGFSNEEVLAANRKKLESRHPEMGVVDVRFGTDAIR